MAIKLDSSSWFNINEGGFTLGDRNKGKVRRYSDSHGLTDCEFKVSLPCIRKIRATGVRAVGAYVNGNVIGNHDRGRDSKDAKRMPRINDHSTRYALEYQVRFNPYRYDCFYVTVDGRDYEVLTADRCHFFETYTMDNGKPGGFVWAEGITIGRAL
jgi:hypothetical protein